MLERRCNIAARLAAGMALLIAASLRAQDAAPREPAVSLACAAEPAVIIDSPPRVLLRAWVTFAAVEAPTAHSGRLHWRTDSGTLRPLSDDGSRTEWLFGSELTPGLIGSGIAQAHALWMVDGVELARCDVQVHRVETGDGGTRLLREVSRSERITARALLLPSKREPEGYGLVGWLLLPAPAHDEPERQRHRAAIDAWLRELVPAESLLAYHERPSRIALTLLPVRSEVKLPEPGESAERRRKVVEELLSAYDYARAQLVLADFGLTGQGRGPHLAAREIVLPGAAASGRLLLDMSGVSGAAMSDWLVQFKWLAAQQRSWGNLAVRSLGLNLRNVLAATAKATPLVLTAMTRHVFLLAPR